MTAESRAFYKQEHSQHRSMQIGRNREQINKQKQAGVRKSLVIGVEIELARSMQSLRVKKVISQGHGTLSDERGMIRNLFALVGGARVDQLQFVDQIDWIRRRTCWRHLADDDRWIFGDDGQAKVDPLLVLELEGFFQASECELDDRIS